MPPAMAEDEAESSPRKAYFAALRQWVHQAQMQQHFASCFPYYFVSLQNPPFTQAGGRGDTPLLLNNNWLGGNIAAGPRLQPGAPQQFVNVNPTAAEAIARHGGYEYVVAPLYKRVVAEVIDFVMLFMLKLTITYIAVDYFNYIDVDNFDVEAFTKNFEDYKQAIEITSEILVLECVYRFLVCLFEGCCIWAGGATPGKALMGLRIVSATAVLSVPNGRRPTVLVYPGGEVSFFTAISRSLIKNLLISLLFPVFVLLLIFQDNRFAYDVLCGVILVEENMFPARRHRP